MAAKSAGALACEVARCAREHPQARAISVVWSYFGSFTAHPAETVPVASDWDRVVFSGTDIRKVTTFRIGKLRELNAHYTEEERNIIGDDD